MITVDEVEELLTWGHETRSFEIKAPGSVADKAFCAKIARAAMAMGNLRDGGMVVVGIDETSMVAMGPGLDEEQVRGWSDHDVVTTALSRFSDPGLSLHTIPLTLSSGARIVVIEVDEFDVAPYICRRDYPEETQAGALYVRPRGMPRSVPVPTAADMRDLIDLATTKGVREFVRRVGLAGLVAPTSQATEESDDDQFVREASRVWGHPSELTTVFDTKAHFDVAVRPHPYVPDRVATADLLDAIEANVVRKRGWPVPMIYRHERFQRHATWIGQDSQAEAVLHTEAWRFTTSGQFLQRRVLATDTRDTAELRPTSSTATGAVAIWDVLLYAVEVAELAARLVTSLECKSVSIWLSVCNIAGRELVSGTWERELHYPYVLDADRLDASSTIDSIELLEDPVTVGVALTQQILGPFGLKLPDSLLVQWQTAVFSS